VLCFVEHAADLVGGEAKRSAGHASSIRSKVSSHLRGPGVKVARRCRDWLGRQPLSPGDHYDLVIAIRQRLANLPNDNGYLLLELRP
jgi:hypothetical protein